MFKTVRSYVRKKFNSQLVFFASMLIFVGISPVATYIANLTFNSYNWSTLDVVGPLVNNVPVSVAHATDEIAFVDTVCPRKYVKILYAKLFIFSPMGMGMAPMYNFADGNVAATEVASRVNCFSFSRIIPKNFLSPGKYKFLTELEVYNNYTGLQGDTNTTIINFTIVP